MFGNRAPAKASVLKGFLVRRRHNWRSGGSLGRVLSLSSWNRGIYPSFIYWFLLLLYLFIISFLQLICLIYLLFKLLILLESHSNDLLFLLLFFIFFTSYKLPLIDLLNLLEIFLKKKSFNNLNIKLGHKSLWSSTKTGKKKIKISHL